MTTRADYINYKFQKADDALKSAEILMANELWADALSKTYYAAFYAVSALLYNLKLNPKTHAGAKGLFHKEFLMTGIINKKFGKLYDNLLAKRFEVDYENFALIDEAEVPEYLNAVKAFVEKAKKITEESSGH